MSPQSIITLPPVKKSMPRGPLTPKSINIFVCLELFWTVFTCKCSLISAHFSCDNFYSVEKAILWMEDLYFLSIGLKCKRA